MVDDLRLQLQEQLQRINDLLQQADVYTIEYQKRGLPHMHLLLFLPQEEQSRDAARVKEIISAEFPTAEDDPDGILMDVVASVTMIIKGDLLHISRIDFKILSCSV